MKEIKAPNNIPLYRNLPAIFLAGSIELGKAEKWQNRVVESLSDLDCYIYNPRRDDWDDSWIQKIENTQFYNQVNWELNALENSDIILMYFDEKTKSPVTLLELGLFARSSKIILYCPDGFWRKGNVDIVCERYSISVANSFEDLIEKVKLKIIEVECKLK